MRIPSSRGYRECGRIPPQRGVHELATKRGGHGSEGRPNLGAKRCYDGYNNRRDQRNDQTVLDRRGAFLILEETNQLFHSQILLENCGVLYFL